MTKIKTKKLKKKHKKEPHLLKSQSLKTVLHLAS